MDVKTALKLAIEVMKKEKQHLAFDANLRHRLENLAPSMLKRAERYAELAEAIRVLEEMKNGKTS